MHSGSAIQAHGSVELDEVRYRIGAKISTIGSYSAHADQQGLESFVAQMREWPSEIRIVHGDVDVDSKIALGERYKAHHRQANRHVEVKIPDVCGKLEPQSGSEK